ncbi:4'-phosphopantetheinyl transferase superfamily protein [bacterium]|nr:4'-phosphopantetheinyl transferase superfamily protein [bacterium]
MNENPTQVYWTIKQAGDSFSSLSLSRLVNILSPTERARYHAMKVEKRRNEWLLGRITTKGLLTTNPLPLNGTPFEDISIDNHPEGAPYISSHPNTGAISISHREEVAACAYTTSIETTIGIDLEWIEPRQFSFVEDFFTPSEIKRIQSFSPGQEQDTMVTLIWSAKEAILKAWQKGLRLDTRHIEILPPHTGIQSEPNRWKLLDWKTDLPGYPDCWLGWQRWGNFILTLAVSANQENKPPTITTVPAPEYPL